MRLYVNIDHVATVRQARGASEPDPVRAAVLVELGGAHGITVHLREDRRHIQDRDVELLVQTARTGVNLELAPDSSILRLACELVPMQATLVPERRREVTTEGGLTLGVVTVRKRIARAVRRLQDSRIRTSLFIAPDEPALRIAADMGVDAVELHTGSYADAKGDRKRARELARLHRSSALGRELGLAVHAGHGLTYENVMPVAALPEIEELNIGHSIVSRAVLVGIERAVREMREIVLAARDRVPEPGRWVPPLGY